MGYLNQLSALVEPDTAGPDTELEETDEIMNVIRGSLAEIARRYLFKYLRICPSNVASINSRFRMNTSELLPS